MTLFIACLIIYDFHMDWKFYIAAVVVWCMKLGFNYNILISDIQSLKLMVEYLYVAHQRENSN